jgi:hypothetical protein
MKPELIAVAVAILAISAGVLLLWPQKIDAPQGAAVVEALAGPQPASEPPARGKPR